VQVVSRNRPENVIRCFSHLKAVSHISDFLLAINEDQKDLYPDIEGVKKVIVPNDYGTTSCAKGNYVIENKLHKGYETFSYIDDDCVVETDGWDLLLSLPLKAKGYGVSWGNDGIQNGRVPTKGTVTTNIIDVLGWLCIPGLIHLFIDDFWKRVGEELNSAHYAPHVLMTHHHWLNKKAEMDATYMENSTREVWAHDERIFTEYMTGQFHDDMERIKKALKLA
jgi:hypothetical protein